MKTTNLRDFLQHLHKNLNTLREREAKYAGDAPLDLLNQIEDHQTAIGLTEQAITGEINEAALDEALQPLLVTMRRRAEENPAWGVTIGEIGGNLVGAIVAGGNVTGNIINVYPPTPATEPAAEPSAPGESPFKGLHYFDTTDANLFFGREQLTAELVGRLRQGRFLAIVGASGSGKSSLARAGLIAALQRGAPLADGSKPPPGSETWPVHKIIPTAQPLKELAASLTHDSESVTATSTLMDDLAKDPRSLDLAVSRILSRRQSGRRLLLLVDQFEELFTLCEDESQRQAFINNLLTAVDEPDGPTVVVITLRADFYAHCARYDRLRALLEQRQKYIGAMSRDELRAAIEQPARLGNWEPEKELVETLLRDVGDEPAVLPLLSHALRETWERRQGRRMTVAGYVMTGGVQRAIATTAGQVYHHELSSAQQAVARTIFIRLTEPGEGNLDSRRRVAHTELKQGTSNADTDTVLKILADARLITTTEEGVEVAHEALIREWPELRAWLDNNRETIRVHRRLAKAAAEWEANGREASYLYSGTPLASAEEQRPEMRTFLNLSDTEEAFINASLAQRRKQERNRRLLFAGAMVTAVVMALLAIFSLFQYQNAERANAAVERELTAAEADLTFSRSISPAVRLESLATLFELKGIAARSNFWGLSRDDQLDLFEADDPRMALVVEGLLPSLADVNRSGYTVDLLPAMVRALERLPQTAEATALQTELAGWVEARQLARDEQAEAALEKYRQLNPQNPAIRYEMADVLTRLGETEAALAELDKLVALAQNPAIAVADTMLNRTDFATRAEMEQAARRLIKLYPALGQALNDDAAGYPHLRQADLVVAPTPTPITAADGAKMMLVPAGPFAMGSNSPQAQSNESPVHIVTLDAFYMDQYEVTNGQYARCVKAGECTLPGSNYSQEQNEQVVDYFQQSDLAEFPVIGINWEQAKKYCEWRDNGLDRLPTEAEWEKAARGVDERTYPWGELLTCQVANFGGCEGFPTPPGSYPTGVSPYGIYDMGGGMLEWTADWYADNYYSNSPAENPTGPDEGTARVLRGGSWANNGSIVRSSYRYYYGPSYQNANIGFRCVRVRPPP